MKSVTDPFSAEPSKSQRKRDAEALQKLGTELLDVPESDWTKLGLPAALIEALTLAGRIQGHGARKRQLQYIGKLMRELDPAPIQQYFEQRRLQARLAAQAHHTLEALRDRLIEEGDAALATVIDAHPDADRRHLRQLIRQARKERTAQRPPKAARALFRYLRELQ